jgi:hypothetical protein
METRTSGGHGRQSNSSAKRDDNGRLNRPSPPPRVFDSGALLAALVFAALTVVATWPLVHHFGSSLPSDLGDPLFVTWVMAWVGRHLTAVAAGDLGAFARMWDAPIFAPDLRTLAYSEHFAAQTVLTLPLAWAGAGPIAVYNAAFLASFWLSALGVCTLVRTLTGRHDAALVAGVIYGFNVYRLISLSHLHTLSAQWPPFAMAGLLVFARSGSRPALAGAAVAVVATAWSSAYYLAYFSPLVVLFGLAVLLQHDRWRTRRGVVALGIALIAIVTALLPFLWPYLEVQRALAVSRPRSEVEMGSLTLDAYAAAGWHLVPMVALAAVAVAAVPRQTMRRHRWAIGLFAVTAMAAMWLSLGPTPRWHGEPVALPGLYGLLLDYVPGFSGLRVAGRMAMVLMLALATLAGMGAMVLACAAPVLGRLAAGVAVLAHLGLYWAAPFPRDTPVGVGTLRAVPASLDPAGPVAPIYEHLRTATDPTAIVVEFPFGEPAYELRYMYAGLTHQRRLLNGYSGIFPPSYRARVGPLRAPWNDHAAAWAALAPATHAVVHEEAWPPAQADAVRRWLAEGGAQPIGATGGATLWRLPPRP